MLEYGSSDHLWSQCKQLRAHKSKVNRRRETDKSLLVPYTINGKINCFKMPILRDIGTAFHVVFHI